jgi:hypothetical protein
MRRRATFCCWAQIVGRIKVGALPVHGYSIIQRREYWAHSDVAGNFYVISLDNINATEAPVAVGLRVTLGTCERSTQPISMHYDICWLAVSWKG